MRGRAARRHRERKRCCCSVSGSRVRKEDLRPNLPYRGVCFRFLLQSFPNLVFKKEDKVDRLSYRGQIGPLLGAFAPQKHRVLASVLSFIKLVLHAPN